MHGNPTAMARAGAATLRCSNELRRNEDIVSFSIPVRELKLGPASVVIVTAITVHDESRRSQIRAKCSCPPTKQSSLLLKGLRCQRSQDILEFPSNWGHAAFSLPLHKLRIVQ